MSPDRAPKAELPELQNSAAEEGVRPSLRELLALRGRAARVQARRGRVGVHGPAPSQMRGRGMEYAESREYVAGDDVRHMDWRLTARTGRAHSKLFQAERERMTLLVMDVASPLFFGTRVRFKSVQAARAAAIAAWSALQSGDRIAALCAGEPALAPASGMRGVMRVLDALVRWYAQPPSSDPGLAQALEHAQRLLRPGARLLVLADPLSASVVPVSRWSALARNHEATLVLLQDPLESAPPMQPMALSGGKGGRFQVDLGREQVRARWEQVLVDPARELERVLVGCGWQVSLLSSEQEADAWRWPASPIGDKQSASATAAAAGSGS